MRIVVTGRTGQVISALVGAAAVAPEVTALAVGRPDFDLGEPETILRMLRRLEPDIVVNAAAYTAVDRAESEHELAMKINGLGAGAVAAAAAALAVPVIQLSTDYVFDGAKPSPYVETDPVCPVNAYGESKLAGEQAVAKSNKNHAILRTSWVYAPRGTNFVSTMLRLAAGQPEVRVVADQHGAPTYAADIATGILTVARNLLADKDNPALRGVFHMTGGGAATWADFATAIFAESASAGGPSARVVPIATADYPTPARRPANSRLDCEKLAQFHGVRLPDWRDALARCMAARRQGA
jgi:dTDP-4-dehydrorhamnose reductase